MKRARYVIPLILVVFLIGCPWQITKQSNADLYYTALGFWQNTMDNFHLVYDPVTDVEKKKEMLPTMEMMLSIKKNVLNMWKLAIANGDTDGAILSNAEWKKAKNQIIIEVVNKYFPDKGGA